MTTPALTPSSHLGSVTSAAVLHLPIHATAAAAATAGRSAESSLCLVRGKFTQETLSIPAAARCSLAFQIPLQLSLRQVSRQLY